MAVVNGETERQFLQLLVKPRGHRRLGEFAPLCLSADEPLECSQQRPIGRTGTPKLQLLNELREQQLFLVWPDHPRFPYPGSSRLIARRSSVTSRK